MPAEADPTWRDLSRSSVHAFEEAAAAAEGPVGALALLAGIRRVHPGTSPVDALLGHVGNSFAELQARIVDTPGGRALRVPASRPPALRDRPELTAGVRMAMAWADGMHRELDEWYILLSFLCGGLLFSEQTHVPAALEDLPGTPGFHAVRSAYRDYLQIEKTTPYTAFLREHVAWSRRAGGGGVPWVDGVPNIEELV
jgi:hypothetical protein